MITRLSWWVYVGVWAGLVLLTGLGWGLAYVQMGQPAKIVVELLLAFIKCVLVLLFFMHLIEGRFTNSLVPIVALWFIALIVGLTTVDVATRTTFPRAPEPGLRLGDD